MSDLSPALAPVNPVIEELKQLQEQHNEYEQQYTAELAALRKKYEAKYEPLFAERAKLVKGEEGKPGVERFWLTVLQSNDVTGAQITEKDAEILAYLEDISEKDILNPAEDGEGTVVGGFELTFTFAENPFFSETILTKTYHMADEEEDMLESAEGCPISWKPGKNPTIKVMKKKGKPGGRGGGRTVTKTERVPSFFHFFSPPQIPSDDDEGLDEQAAGELQELLENDFELGDQIRRSIIPYAVSWYTGELQNSDDVEDDEEDEDGDDEDEESEEEDEEDDSEEDTPVKKTRPQAADGRKAGKRGAPGAGTALPTGGGEKEKEECKQQ